MQKDVHSAGDPGVSSGNLIMLKEEDEIQDYLRGNYENPQGWTESVARHRGCLVTTVLIPVWHPEGR
jgi:hypothetical protein